MKESGESDFAKATVQQTQDLLVQIRSEREDSLRRREAEKAANADVARSDRPNVVNIDRWGAAPSPGAVAAVRPLPMPAAPVVRAVPVKSRYGEIARLARTACQSPADLTETDFQETWRFVQGIVEDKNAYKRFSFRSACERGTFNLMMERAALHENYSRANLAMEVRRYHPAPPGVYAPPPEPPSRQPDPPKTNPCWPNDCVHNRSW
ncbi:MAG: hypothetical protein CO113_02920 [Elusimicrobia bacterium CG_4_9_14_3_um_filter_62_55]|nr:MAG: hypothetical protein COR54_15000 [Elusimicrobia bacterium CG22_combo_CG10-13_8_21_14_all_63_91]PJA17877.1 MAG: hypothetical protein COX66_03010 [Elusimicrobia bacterium CG_4_10_14_0_2_um_filter_63_34]PJB26575.1 MAG: hypothetical protein CO113_02920 [Elusimicrobia bacterium CG_4_9_14_3_um_filter_62_55]